MYLRCKKRLRISRCAAGWQTCGEQKHMGVQKEAAEHSKDWKIGMVAFDHVLSALKEVRAQHDKDQQGQHAADSDSSSSSDEDEAAPAAPPPKKKARLQQVAARHPHPSLVSGLLPSYPMPPPIRSAFGRPGSQAILCRHHFTCLQCGLLL